MIDWVGQRQQTTDMELKRSLSHRLLSFTCETEVRQRSEAAVTSEAVRPSLELDGNFKVLSRYSTAAASFLVLGATTRS